MFRLFLTCLAAAASFCVSVFSESITGSVRDPQGKPVSGIHLLLTQHNGTVASSLSDATGYYSFQNIQPGVYALKVHQLGFQREQRKLEVTAGRDLSYNVLLQLKTVEEQVVVTATRIAAVTSLLGNSVTVITDEEIRAQHASHIAEVLRNVPGINVRQVGGKGSLTSLFLRGGESDYTKVLLDGVPLNQPGGAIDLSNLSTANVERIEIVRGPQSALYGSDAIAGVIQIFTQKGSVEHTVPRFDFFAEAGTYDTVRGGAGLQGGVGRLTYSAQFQHLSTDNSAPNDFFHHNSFSTSIGLETSSNSALAMVGRIERSKSGVPGPTAFGRPDLEEFYRKRDFALGLTWHHRLSDSWQQKISYSQAYVNQLSADTVDSGTFFPEFQGKTATFPSFDFVPLFFLSATRRHNVNYQSDFILSDHLLSAGLDYEEQRGVVDPVRAARTNFGYYVQDQFLLLQRLAITGGLRLEDNGSFGFAAIPRVSLAYLLRNGSGNEFWGVTRSKFNFGLGIKEPTFIESFSQNFFFKGNPDLKPERTRSFEVGLEQIMAQNRVSAEVNFFHSHFRDQIAFQTVDIETFEGSFFNIGESRAWGSEQIVRVILSENFDFSAGYTYLNSKVLKSNNSDPVFQEGARLLLRPTHSAFLGLTWGWRQWLVHTNATFIGNRADSDFLGIGLTEVDGYVKWDLSGTYQISSHLQFYVACENIFNQDYFETIGFPALKFNFRSGVRFGF